MKKIEKHKKVQGLFPKNASMKLESAKAVLFQSFVKEKKIG